MDGGWHVGLARRFVSRTALLVSGLAIQAGCGGSRLENASISISASDLAANGPPTYNIGLSVFGDSACKSANASFTVTLDGAPLATEDCVAGASGFLDDRSFTIGLHDGGATAEVVVSNLFPGLRATVVGSLGGQVVAGSMFDVAVPTELQFEAALQFGAQFTYTDANDPTYLGDATNPTAGSDVIHVLAPQHIGHFTLWISMSVPPQATITQLRPKGTIVSCAGMSSCSAFGAPDIGPLAIEVVAKAASPGN